jgi:hypothetical protein
VRLCGKAAGGPPGGKSRPASGRRYLSGRAMAKGSVPCFSRGRFRGRGLPSSSLLPPETQRDSKGQSLAQGTVPIWGHGSWADSGPSARSYNIDWPPADIKGY